MEDIPQVSRKPYAVGDRVQIHPNSEDVQYQGSVCEIGDVLTDGLGAEIGSPTDAYWDTFRGREITDELSLSVCHRGIASVKDDH